MHIKEEWKQHPLYEQGKIEMIPTKWVVFKDLLKNHEQI